MGLSSLPVLNKISADSAWLSSWAINKSSNITLNTALSLEIILKKLTQERFFFTRSINLIKGGRSYTSALTSGKDPRPIIPHSFIGEVWFFRYTDTLIISPSFLSMKYLDRGRVKIRVQQTLLALFWLQYYDFF